jgi:hypothetical protein
MKVVRNTEECAKFIIDSKMVELTISPNLFLAVVSRLLCIGLIERRYIREDVPHHFQVLFYLIYVIFVSVSVP